MLFPRPGKLSSDYRVVVKTTSSLRIIVEVIPMFPHVGNIQWQPMVVNAAIVNRCVVSESLAIPTVHVAIRTRWSLVRGLVTESLPAEAWRKSSRASYAKP